MLGEISLPTPLPAWVLVVGLTLTVFALAMLGMGIGVLMRGKPLQKGCGKVDCGKNGCRPLACAREPDRR